MTLFSWAKTARVQDLATSTRKALAWIEKNSLPGGGIIVHSKERKLYAEVSGYLVPTLLDAGRADLAKAYLERLLVEQSADGSWGLNGKPYLFDTCQILEGLLWGLREGIVEPPRLRDSATRALAWVISQIDERGLLNSAYHDAGITEQVHLRSIRNAHALSVQLGDASANAKLKTVAQNYMFQKGALRRAVLSHFYCYELDGWLYFAPERGLTAARALVKEQRPDGGIDAWPGAGWTCYVGVAQAAAIFRQADLKQDAQRAVEFLTRVQKRSGGFTGSDGDYFPRQEISWGAKFFLDAAFAIESGRQTRALFEVGAGA